MSNEQKKKSPFSSKKFRHGTFAVLLIAAVIVITVLLNVVVSTLDNVWGLSYDLSSNKLYTISAQSKKVVSAVNQPVNIYALMQTGSESTTIENLLENYRKLAPDYIKVTVVDPVQNPTFANQFTQESLSTNSVIVTNGDGSRYRIIDHIEAAPSERPSEFFGKKVFNRQKMYKYLPSDVYEKLIDVIDNGSRLDRSIADAVAAGMKLWAEENGVTHYTHWFQPLTEGTAEKHDAFVEHPFSVLNT